MADEPARSSTARNAASSRHCCPLLSSYMPVIPRLSTGKPPLGAPERRPCPWASAFGSPVAVRAGVFVEFVTEAHDPGSAALCTTGGFFPTADRSTSVRDEPVVSGAEDAAVRKGGAAEGAARRARDAGGGRSGRRGGAGGRPGSWVRPGCGRGCRGRPRRERRGLTQYARVCALVFRDVRLL